MSKDVEYGQDDDDGDDDEGEEEDMLVLAPEHPLMRRVQEALKTQLTKKKEDLRLQLYAEKEALKAAQKDREDIGVELYTIQQQLAKQQVSYYLGRNCRNRFYPINCAI